jgi:hypothetical protein
VPRFGLASLSSNAEVLVDADLDTLAAALHVRTDDLARSALVRALSLPVVGIAGQIADGEVITLAVLQVLAGHTRQARGLRYADAHLRHLCPYLPGQSGYDKRLRAVTTTMTWLITVPARWVSLWGDDVWVVDSTPVWCA